MPQQSFTSNGGSTFAEEFHMLQNQMRQLPEKFIPDLEAMLPNFSADGQELYIDQGNGEFVKMEMVEGREAVMDLIEYLRNVKSVDKLEWDDGVAQASRDHVEDTGMSGVLGHLGRDGSNPFDRLDRYTKVKGNCAESLNYGENSPKEVLLWLAIDDGVQSRGHRESIMNPSFTRFGCHQGYHSIYHAQTVCVYAGSEETMKPFQKFDHGFDMATFIAEKVDFENQPSGNDGYQQSSQCQFDSETQTATKTITRTYKMKEGIDIVREVTVSKHVS